MAKIIYKTLLGAKRNSYFGISNPKNEKHHPITYPYFKHLLWTGQAIPKYK
jgi:hypothetical protein